MSQFSKSAGVLKLNFSVDERSIVQLDEQNQP